jgi:lysophospholipase L1-like esterase
MGGVTLDALLDVRQYDAVYIMLGINDMGSKRKSYLSSYSSLVSHVQEKQPNAGIVIQSILAVTSSYTAEHPNFNNDEIRERNTSLAALADGEHIFYLDLNAYFVDAAGNLQDSQARDGLHLKSSSYKVWKEALLAHGIVK